MGGGSVIRWGWYSVAVNVLLVAVHGVIAADPAVAGVEWVTGTGRAAASRRPSPDETSGPP